MSINISELRRERRELEGKKNEIEAKIEAIARTIQAYSPKQDSGGRSVAIGVDFQKEAEAIFKERGNKPLKMSEIVTRVKSNHPDLTPRQIKSKIAYAKRSFLNNVSYGLYNFKDLSQLSGEQAQKRSETNQQNTA